MVRIYVDVMGGDQAPQAGLQGIQMALAEFPELSVCVGGTAKALSGIVPSERLQLDIQEQVVENDEHNPASAVRSKPDSSLMHGMTMVRHQEMDGLVSAANTGAVLAGATLIVGRIPGVKRPALPVGLPAKDGTVWMLDVGANMDCKPEYLVQFARMMSIYLQKQQGVQDPSVGLLNVGTEPAKGNALSKEAFELLSEDPMIHFIGNVEGTGVLEHAADIIVTDGFAGNVFLKGLEGTSKYILRSLKSAILSSLKTKIGGLLIRSATTQLKQKLDPSAVGGTPLLGINGAVIKAHGNADALAYRNAIAQAMTYLKADISHSIGEAMEGKADE